MKRFASGIAILCAGLVGIAAADQGNLDIEVTVEPRVVPAGGGALITVLVTSAGLPVADVDVRLESEGGVFGLAAHDASGSTDQQGAFRTVWRAGAAEEASMPGFHAVDYTATKEGFPPVTGRLLLQVLAAQEPAPGTRRALYVLARAEPPAVEAGTPARVTVTVREGSARGAPVAGAHVAARAHGGLFGGTEAAAVEGDTDAEGVLRLVWLAPSGPEQRTGGVVALAVRATHAGYDMGNATLEVGVLPSSTPSPGVPDAGRSLFVRAAVDPAEVRPGGAATVGVEVRAGSADAPPVAGALIQVIADGGVFPEQRGSAAAARTDERGVALLAWRTGPAEAYGSQVQHGFRVLASARGYADGVGQAVVLVKQGQDAPPETPGGRLVLAAWAEPTTVPAGGMTTVTARVSFPSGEPLEGADVVVSAGGGSFEGGTGGSVGGRTGPDGTFRAVWKTLDASAYAASMGYVIGVRASHPRHGMAATEVPVEVAVPRGPGTPARGLVAEAGADPGVVVAGGHATILVQVRSLDGAPASGARVEVSAGSGSFEGYHGAAAQGVADGDGRFRVVWKTADPSAYAGDLDVVLGVVATARGYAEARAHVAVRVTPAGAGPGLAPVTPVPLPGPQQPLTVSVVPDRASLAAGSTGWISVRATGPDGAPVAGATIDLRASGGTFLSSSAREIQGTTDAQGRFRAQWRTDGPDTYRTARSHEFVAGATRSGFREATGRGVLVVTPLDIR